MKKSISQFVLKIVAIVTMVIDHIGAILYQFDVISSTDIIWYVTRIIGRISLPLFCFFIFEGIRHTRSKKNYLTRLGGCAVILTIGMIILSLIGIQTSEGNIFLDLFFGAFSVALFTREDNKKWLGLLPSIYPIFSQIAMIYEFNHGYPLVTSSILCSYGIYAYLIIVGYFAFYKICETKSKKLCLQTDLDWNEFQKSDTYQKNQNLFAVLSLFLINLIFFIISKVSTSIYVTLGFSLQDYSILAGAFLLFYSGKRGYNSKWFQYGCYLFYPLHLALIYGIIYLIAG